MDSHNHLTVIIGTILDQGHQLLAALPDHLSSLLHAMMGHCHTYPAHSRSIRECSCTAGLSWASPHPLKASGADQTDYTEERMFAGRQPTPQTPQDASLFPVRLDQDVIITSVIHGVLSAAIMPYILI